MLMLVDVFIAPLSTPQMENSWTNMKGFLKFCEVFMVVSALLIIIGLLTIPTVFYALPSEQTRVCIAKSANTNTEPLNKGHLGISHFVL